MLLDWLVFASVTWATAALLNATAFKKQPANRFAVWALTAAMFIVSLVAMTAMQILRYEAISSDLGFTIKPKSPLDFVGAFTFSWLFFSLLRKQPKRLPTSAPSTSGEGASESIVRAFVPEVQPPPPLPISARVASGSTSPPEKFWAAALLEFDGSSRRAGLWAKSFAEAQGNEAVAKANYLRSRACELSREHQLAEQDRQASRLEAEEGERQAKLLRAEQQKAADQRAFDRLPSRVKGKCPNCGTVVLLTAKECAACKAMFDGEAAWKPTPLSET